MSDGMWIALITVSGVIGPALVAGIYRLFRDRNMARQTAMRKVRDEALAQARAESLVREARATVAAKDGELRAKDALLAEREATLVLVRGRLGRCEQATSELRRALLVLGGEDPA